MREPSGDKQREPLEEPKVPKAQQRYSVKAVDDWAPRMVESWERPKLDATMRNGMFGVLLVSVLALGGVHFWTGVPLAIVSLGLGALSLKNRWHEGARFGAIGTLLVVWVFLSALQLVPLPVSLVALISPNVAAQHLSAYEAVGRQATWVTLSLSPLKSAEAIWTSLGFLGLYLVAFTHFRARSDFLPILTKLTTVAVVFVAVAAVQSGLGDNLSLPFIGSTTSQLGILRTTLVNPNHAATLLGAVLFITLGVSVADTLPGQRNVFLTLYFFLVVALVLTGSVRVVLIWALSHVVFFTLTKTRGLPRWGAALAIVVAFVLVAGIAGVAADRLSETVEERVFNNEGEHSISSPETIEELEENNLQMVLDAGIREQPLPTRLERSEILEESKLIAADYPFGIGRDAFVDVYPQYIATSTNKTLRHVENEFVELSLEYGPLFALLFFCALGVALIALMVRPDWRPNEMPALAGLLTAAAFIGLENLFDFSFRVPAIAYVLAITLGLCAGRAVRYSEVDEETGTLTIRQTEGLAHSVSLLLLLLVTISVVIAAVSLPRAYLGSTGEDLAESQHLIDEGESIVDKDGGGKSALLESVLMRPLSARASLLIAVGLLNEPAPDLQRASGWLERVTRLDPNDYRAHLLLGRVDLVERRYGAAAASLARAADLQVGPSVEVLRTAAQLPTFEGLRAAMPSESVDRSLFGSFLLEQQRYEEALSFADELSSLSDGEVDGLELTVRIHLALKFPEAAVDSTQRLLERHPKEAVSVLRAAQVSRALGEERQADRLLAEGIDEHPRSAGLLFERANLLIRAEQDAIEDLVLWRAEVEALLRRLRPIALGSTGKRYQYHLLSGLFMQMVELPRQALRSYEQASELRPEEREPLLGILESAIELGDIEEAEDALVAFSKVATNDEVKTYRERLAERKAELQKRGLSLPPMESLKDETDARNSRQTTP